MRGCICRYSWTLLPKLKQAGAAAVCVLWSLYASRIARCVRPLHFDCRTVVAARSTSCPLTCVFKCSVRLDWLAPSHEDYTRTSQGRACNLTTQHQQSATRRPIGGACGGGQRSAGAAGAATARARQAHLDLVRVRVSADRMCNDRRKPAIKRPRVPRMRYVVCSMLSPRATRLARSQLRDNVARGVI